MQKLNILDGRQRGGSAEGLELPQEPRAPEQFPQDTGAGPALGDRDSAGDYHQRQYLQLMNV